MVVDFLERQGLTWAYRWINDDGKSPVILFLHEGLGSIEQWKSYPQQLCDETGFSGLIYDRQGYGQSSALTQKRDHTYLHKYALDELPMIVDELIQTGRELHLYGHSDGGSIALIYAANYPQRVKSLVTEAAHVIVEDITLAGITPVVELFEKGRLREGLSKYHGNKTEDIFYAWSDTWHLKRFRDWNITGLLPQIDCPVLAIQGTEDEYGTETQLDLIKAHCTGEVEKLWLSDCGHAPYKEQQSLVLVAATEFLRKYGG